MQNGNIENEIIKKPFVVPFDRLRIKSAKNVTCPPQLEERRLGRTILNNLIHNHPSILLRQGFGGQVRLSTQPVRHSSEGATAGGERRKGHYATACIIFICLTICAEIEKKHIEEVTIKKICEKKEDSNELHCTLLACIEDNKAIAQLVYETDENIIRIHNLHVKKRMRNNGIGRALMHYLLAEIQKLNYSKIELFSAANATQFYKKFGFLCEKSFDLHFDNAYFCYLALQKCCDQLRK